jgi:hypothetical protein
MWKIPKIKCRIAIIGKYKAELELAKAECAETVAKHNQTSAEWIRREEGVEDQMREQWYREYAEDLEGCNGAHLTSSEAAQDGGKAESKVAFEDTHMADYDGDTGYLGQFDEHDFSDDDDIWAAL